MTSPRGFDLQRFFAAVDARRRDEQLSWPALTAAIWEKSRVLNKRRSDHPISPATIRKLAEGVSCQHALFVLRWLGVPPETFIAVPKQGTAGVPLPLADEAHRLRWNLKKLYGALNAASSARGATPPGSKRPIVRTAPRVSSPACARQSLPPACDWRCVLPRHYIAQRPTSSMSRNGSDLCCLLL